MTQKKLLPVWLSWKDRLEELAEAATSSVP